MGRRTGADCGVLRRRGEWASIQLILRASQGVPSVRVTAEGLPEPQVRWAEFVTVENRSSKQAVGRDATIADPLLPVGQHDLTAGHNQPVWVTFKVPADEKPCNGQ